MQQCRNKPDFMLQFDPDRIGIDIYVKDKETHKLAHVGFFVITRVNGYPLIPDAMVHKIEKHAQDDFELIELTNELYDMMEEAEENGFYF